MEVPRYHHGDLKNALIRAGIQVLAQGGMEHFSLRKVARAAGVSHSAPYAHFTDRQALIAAISTAGFEMLLDRLTAAIAACPDELERQVSAVIGAYLDFAQTDPDLFRVTFSTSLDVESDYPAFADVSRRSYDLLIRLVAGWQRAGIVPPGEPEIAAVALWGMLHGVIILYMDRQIPITVSGRYSLQEIVFRAFRQVLPASSLSQPTQE